MANRMPSMLALLGLLAVAGYQNRDKISEALKGVQNRTGAAGDGNQDGLGGLLSDLGGLLGGGAAGGGLAGGSAICSTASGSRATRTLPTRG